tara:strand:+ start:713 stop:913 length:201 start_codon:yes stop_codon:yes gene_type:complete
MFLLVPAMRNTLAQLIQELQVEVTNEDDRDYLQRISRIPHSCYDDVSLVKLFCELAAMKEQQQLRN